jgi:hypothetical protein
MALLMRDLIRLIMLLVGAFFAFGPMFMFAAPNGIRTLGIVGVLATLPFMALGGYFVWCCVFRWDSLSDHRDPKGDPNCPDYSDDALVCQYIGPAGGVHSVIVDFVSKQIHFQNCHVPRKFLAVTQPWFSCPLDDVFECYRRCGQGGYSGVAIVTKSGTAFVPVGTTNHDQLFQSLQEAIPINRQVRVPAVDHPLTGFIGVGALIASGLLAGWLTPKHTDDATLALIVLGGSVAGFFAFYQIVNFVDRLLRKDDSPKS